MPAWDALLRRYLVLEEPSLLDQAIAAAEGDVVGLLQAVKSRDGIAVNELAPKVSESLNSEERTDEAITAWLILADCWARAVTDKHVPPAQRDRTLRVGMKACEDAVRLATLLEDRACAAFYLGALAAGLRRARRPADAHVHLEKALRFLRRPDSLEWAYEPLLAKILAGSGKALRDLHEWPAAQQRLEEAVALWRRLAGATAGHEASSLAWTLNSLGGVYQQQGRASEARVRFEEAVALHRDALAADPKNEDALCAVSVTLNNLGNVLRDLHDLTGARALLDEALEHASLIAGNDPDAYEPLVATTLNNLGLARLAAGEHSGAREWFEKAVAIRERHGLWLDSADVHYNLGLLEQAQGRAEHIIADRFETSVARCERGLDQLAEHGHRNLFKGRIEFAYRWLIGYYARALAAPERPRQEGEGDAEWERLIGLMEALRQAETLSELGIGATTLPSARWREAHRDLASGQGELSDLFRRERCALLWVHSAPDSIIFVIQTPGRREVAIAPRTLLDAFWGLFDAAEQAMTRELPAGPLSRAERVRCRSAVAERLPAAGEAVYESLPAPVRAVLTEGRYNTIFIAPCGATVFVPFEIIRIPGDAATTNTKAGWDDAYVGLRVLLPRVRGLAELADVLRRRPAAPVSRARAVVVIDPTVPGLNPLPDLARAGRDLARRLRASDFDLVLPNGKALSGKRATAAAVLEALGCEGLVYWGQQGHGARPEDTQGSEYLVMAGKGRLYPRDLARLRLRGVVVHLDICVAGMTRPRGGGRFDGHPVAALRAGASCVLSSTHAIWDETAAEFSDRLYEWTLPKRKGSLPHAFGDALLHTRRGMAAIHENNPTVWAAMVLWGNPWVSLPQPEGRRIQGDFPV